MIDIPGMLAILTVIVSAIFVIAAALTIKHYLLNKKIYVVTFGEYSDYGIEGAFSTEELAQTYIDSGKIAPPGPYHIETYEIDEYVKFI